MGASPTIANVVAQIAIDGTAESGSTQAPRKRVIDSMTELGFPRANVASVLQRAIDLGVVRHTSDDKLEIRK
jgi:hypothetical protein